MRKKPRKYLSTILSLLLVALFVGLPTSANASSVSAEGINYSWPDLVYAPQSTADQALNSFNISYQNNSGKDYYYIGYSISDPNDKLLTGNMVMGVKNGTSGTISVTFSYMSFLNFTGPTNYIIRLCSLVDLSVSEKCSKQTIVIKKKSANDPVGSNSGGTNSSDVNSASSLNVQGVQFSWNEELFIPNSSSPFPILVNIKNNSGKDLLQVKWILKDANGVVIGTANLIDFKNGASYLEVVRAYASNFKNGPGNYIITARVDFFGGAGSAQLEKTVKFKSLNENQLSEFDSSQVSDANSMNINGLLITWPENISIPEEGSSVNFEVQFKNTSNRDILQGQFWLFDYKGQYITDLNKIDLESGANAIEEHNIYASNFPLGPGIYKIVGISKEFGGLGSYTSTSYVEVKGTPGPPKEINDLSANRNGSQVDYTFSAPASSSPINYYYVYAQYLLSSTLDPSSYANYSQLTYLKRVTEENFSITSEEFKSFLTGKVPNIANTAVMIRIYAVSDQGAAKYYSNGIYTKTAGFLTSSAAKKTITCQKGSTKKKISGTNPKCPSGYKKVA